MGKADRDAALDFLSVEVGCRIPVLHTLHAVDGAGCVEHRARERRLSGVVVSSERQVSDLVCAFHLH